MVDIITVIPIWITAGRNLPLLSATSTFADFTLFAMFGLSSTRILRSLRLRRKLSTINDSVERYLKETILGLFVFLLFFAAIMQFFEDYSNPHPFHDWIYFVVVTLASVGYGDITPHSTLGRVFDMMMISSAIVMIPTISNELITKMNIESVYVRGRYVCRGVARHHHVVICGDLQSTSTALFLRGIFHKDQSMDDLHVVFLLSEPPSVEMMLLLSHSPFSASLTYLQGSASSATDLDRARVDMADAVFIMTNKFSSDPDAADNRSLFFRIAILNYLRERSTPSRRNFQICLQLLRPESKARLTHEITMSGYNIEEVILCLGDLKMGILAKALSFPGANTLLVNLITPYAPPTDRRTELAEDEEPWKRYKKDFFVFL